MFNKSCFVASLILLPTLVWPVAAQVPTKASFHPNLSPVVPYGGSPGPMVPGPVLADSTAVLAGDLHNVRAYFDIAALEDRYLFAVTGRGITVYDLVDPTSPVELLHAHLPDILPTFVHSDLDHPFTNLEVLPQGGGDAIVVIGGGSHGFAVLAWSGGTLQTTYQDFGQYSSAVYGAQVSGHDLALVSDGSGLVVYDVTGCLSACTPAKTVTGIEAREVDGTDEYVVTIDSLYDVEIWDFTDPVVPELRSSGSIAPRVNQAVLWKDGSQLFMAATTADFVAPSSDLEVFNVTCALSSGGCNLGSSTAYAVPTEDGLPFQNQRFLSDLDCGDKTYLYVGPGSLDSVCADQREYLFNAGKANNLVEVTPTADYWGWYYSSCRPLVDGVPEPTGPGFNSAVPMRAAIVGNYLYRAAYSFLDSHFLGNVCGSGVLADDFESGDTTRWSLTEGGV